MDYGEEIEKALNEIKTKDDILNELERLRKLNDKWFKPVEGDALDYMPIEREKEIISLVNKAMKAFGAKREHKLRLAPIRDGILLWRDYERCVGACKHNGIDLSTPKNKVQKKLFEYVREVASEQVFDDSKRKILPGSSFREAKKAAEFDLTSHISYVFYYGNSEKNPFTHMISLWEMGFYVVGVPEGFWDGKYREFLLGYLM